MIRGVLVGVGILALVVAVLAVRPDADRDAVIAAYAAPDSRFLTLPDGAVAHVRIAGPEDGEPLVLLHGFASSSWAWDGWTDRLANDFRVIRVDLLGHGLTRTGQGGPDQQRFLKDTLDALGVGRMALAGNSMGGAIAWSFAAANPERVSALILVDSAGPSAGGPPRRVRQIMDAWYAPLLRTAARWAGGTLIMRMSMQSGVADPRGVRDEDVRRADLFWRLHRAELLSGFQAMAAVTRPPLSAITAPTLVIQGGQDRLVPRAAADALVAGIGGAVLKVYPALGHTPHQEDPAATAADVRAFLQARAPRG
ncbi:MAG: alpha/beta hydrolase [Hyphomonadaceae bacterium]|nr:alpha/beta hydrolase [Hyphomonadaceae bacterium]